MILQLYNLRKVLDSGEFSINDLLIYFHGRYKRIKSILIAILFIFLSVLIFDLIYSPSEFECKAYVVGERAEQQNSLLGISSMVGINAQSLESTNDVISVEMYSDIIKSTTFQYELLKMKVISPFDKADSIRIGDLLNTYEDFDILSYLRGKYLSKKSSVKQSISLNEFSQDEVFASQIPLIKKINIQNLSLIDKLKSRIKFEKKDKYLYVTAKMRDPLSSALLCKLVLEKMIKYISAFKNLKHREQVNFLEEKFKIAKENYLSAQSRYASSKDMSLGLILQSSKIREKILENELTVSFNVYNQLMLQLEQAKLNEKANSPIFTSIDPIQIPEYKLSTNVFLIIFKYFIYYLVISFILLIFSILFHK